MCLSIFSASLLRQKTAAAAAAKSFPRALTSHIKCKRVAYAEWLKRHDLLRSTFEENSADDAVGG